MATPVTLRLLSGDLLVIHPTSFDNWDHQAWKALPEAERPAHPGQVRICLSGDRLTIHPTPSDNWAFLAWKALPEAERPAHPGKIRILPGTDGDYPTLWIDPPTRDLCTNDMGIVTDGQHNYVHVAMALEEDEDPYEIIYFFYRYDPLGPVEHILYHATDVQYASGRLTIPDGVQPVPVDQFLPREWYDLLEDGEEKWRDELDGLCADYFEDEDAMEEEFVERMMNLRPAFMERVGQ